MVLRIPKEKNMTIDEAQERYDELKEKQDRLRSELTETNLALSKIEEYFEIEVDYHVVSKKPEDRGLRYA